jgi:hypothetical protein
VLKFTDSGVLNMWDCSIFNVGRRVDFVGSHAVERVRATRIRPDLQEKEHKRSENLL